MGVSQSSAGRRADDAGGTATTDRARSARSTGGTATTDHANSTKSTGGTATADCRSSIAGAIAATSLGSRVSIPSRVEASLAALCGFRLAAASCGVAAAAGVIPRQFSHAAWATGRRHHPQIWCWSFKTWGLCARAVCTYAGMSQYAQKLEYNTRAVCVSAERSISRRGTHTHTHTHTHVHRAIDWFTMRNAIATCVRRHTRAHGHGHKVWDERGRRPNAYVSMCTSRDVLRGRAPFFTRAGSLSPGEPP